MILFKKALRSIWYNKNSYIACIVLISIGVLIYVSLGVAIEDLDSSRAKYYKDYTLADIFASVNSIPKAEEDKLLKIEGIEDVYFRYVYDAKVNMPDNDKVITLRLISYDTSVSKHINEIIKTGNDFYSENDILISKTFLETHNLNIGDSLNVIIDGKEKSFNICGIAESPEYVYTIKDSKEIMPDPSTFSVAYIPLENLANLLNKHDIYNDINFTLKDDYTYDDVKVILEDELNKFGLKQLIEQKDQMSVSMLASEIKSNTSMTTTIPFVFIFMAIIILYIMLKRVIEQDRIQIGTLKAFGYTNAKIVNHYLFYGLITGFFGGLIGDIIGYFLAGSFSDMYKIYFSLPLTVKSSSAKYIITGFLISILGGLFGAYMGVKGITKLLPSEAMRPVSPKVTNKNSLKYFPFLKYILNSNGYMALRNISRNKFRSLFIVVGIMFSFGILAFIGSFPTMIDTLLLNQYTKIQLYDNKINFNTPVNYTEGVESIINIDGVKNAEGLLEIPVQLKNKNKKQGIVITGIPKNSEFYKIYDDDKKITLPPSQEGIILSSRLADDLEAKKGDIVYINTNILKNDIKIIVTDVVTQNLGSACYMESNMLAEVFNLPKTATSVILKTEDRNYIKNFLKDSKNIGYIEDKQNNIEKYEDLLDMTNYMLNIMAGMGVIVAFAIIYNTATISLSERKREFATLRVIGMQVEQVGSIMSFEYWILSFCGIILGFPFTSFLKNMVSNTIDMDIFSFPTYTPPSAYLIGIIGCILAVFISNMVSINKIKYFDMVEVLKERE